MVKDIEIQNLILFVLILFNVAAEKVFIFSSKFILKMNPPCKIIKYLKKRRKRPIVVTPKPPTPHSYTTEEIVQPEQAFQDEGEGMYIEDLFFFPQPKIDLLREWVQKQRYIPHRLSEAFLILFLSAAEYNVDSAAQKMQQYFYSRQEPSFLFRNRDPLSPENMKILQKIYVLPMPGTTIDGKKVLLTGLVESATSYSQKDHAKILAMTIDLLIWEGDFSYGDFVVVLDGRCFKCPQLLENKVPNHKEITKLLLDTIPGTLRSFYLFYPPNYVSNVADNRNGIWVTIVKNKREMSEYLWPNILPVEFGGNVGHLGDLLEKWILHVAKNQDFFIHFEKRMIYDYRRRVCHEERMKQKEKGWVQNMKLMADETEYKMKYYEMLKNYKPPVYPGFGNNKPHRHLSKSLKDPLEEFRKIAKEQEEKEKVFEPSILYYGFAKEIRKAKLIKNQKEREAHPGLMPILELEIRCI